MLTATVVAWLLSAQPGPALELEWDAPPSCPQREEVWPRLDGLSGRLRATVREASDGFVLEVSAVDATRRLVASTCEDAVEAAVLIAHLMLARRPVQREPLPIVAAVPPPPTSPPALRAWTLHASLTAGAALAWVPRPLVGGDLRLLAERTHLGLGLDVGTSMEERFLLGDLSGAPGAVLRVPLDVQAVGCWRWSLGRVRVGPCVSAGMRLLDVRGYNLAVPKQSTTPLWTAGLGARSSVRLTAWLELVAGVAARTGARPAIFFGDSGTLVEAGPVTVDVWGGLGGFW